MKKLFFILTHLLSVTLYAQFPAPAGKPGSTAMHADSTAFIAWASSCTVSRGWQDVSNPNLGKTQIGDSTSALGKAGQNGVVSLGDGGYAILTFDAPVMNGPGWDFAVFENAFSDSFLELAFVEVSSDGINFFRFPATSLTQTDIQVGTFDTINAEQIHNLAGKYRAMYGTPFDLEELKNTPGLDVDAVTHIKIIDVVGSILPAYTTYDHLGNKINEPWPTPFPSGGFDLDAVGVIHQAGNNIDKWQQQAIHIYPNPVSNYLFIQGVKIKNIHLMLFDMRGKILLEAPNFTQEGIDLSAIENGMYILHIVQEYKTHTQKILVKHE